MPDINVMVIDDDELDRYLALRAVKALNLSGRVAELEDGSHAVDLFESPDFIATWGPPPPTLVLLDINMPRMSGFELLEYLQERNIKSDWSSCVVLMLTSSNNRLDRERASVFPLVRDYIQKPLDVEKLRAVLNQHYGLQL